jgi:hypothetical protein
MFGLPEACSDACHLPVLYPCTLRSSVTEVEDQIVFTRAIPTTLPTTLRTLPGSPTTFLPAPQDQGGWGQVSNQRSPQPQPQPQPLSTTTSINNMTSLHANIRSVSLARPKQNTYSSDVTKFSIQQRLALRSVDEIGSIVQSSPKIQSFSLMPGNPGRASVTGSGLSKGLAR